MSIAYYFGDQNNDIAVTIVSAYQFYHTLILITRMRHAYCIYYIVVFQLFSRKLSFRFALRLTQATVFTLSLFYKAALYKDEAFK